jgi:hypothetical protein
MKQAIVCAFVLAISALPLFPQAADSSNESQTLIGLRLSELIDRFGAPAAVYAARGIEAWQDDVVFEYPHGNFYIYRDRVWQVSLSSAYGIKLRDSRAAVMLTLGSRAEDLGEYVFCPVSGTGAWSSALRIYFDNTGVSSIFIYRSDF